MGKDVAVIIKQNRCIIVVILIDLLIDKMAAHHYILQRSQNIVP